MQFELWEVIVIAGLGAAAFATGWFFSARSSGNKVNSAKETAKKILAAIQADIDREGETFNIDENKKGRCKNRPSYYKYDNPGYVETDPSSVLWV